MSGTDRARLVNQAGKRSAENSPVDMRSMPREEQHEHVRFEEPHRQPPVPVAPVPVEAGPEVTPPTHQVTILVLLVCLSLSLSLSISLSLSLSLSIYLSLPPCLIQGAMEVCTFWA